MRFTRTLGEARIQADMTPMIDVVFQLLIFFLCNLQYRTLEGRIDAFLPKERGAAHGDTTLVTPVEVTLRVALPGERRDPLDPTHPWSGEGPYELVGRELLYGVGPRRTRALVDVERWLTELAASSADRSLVLDPREGALYDDVVPVLDLARTAGFESLRFVGR